MRFFHLVQCFPTFCVPCPTEAFVKFSCPLCNIYVHNFYILKMNYYLYKYNYKNKILLIDFLYGFVLYTIKCILYIAEASYYQILLTFIFSNMGN